MPYELRPEAKLKRPARYDESDDSDLSGSPEPKSENRDSVIDSQVSPPPNTLTATPGAPKPLILPTGAPHLSPNPSPEKDKPEVPRATIPNTSDPRGPLKSRGMAHVKYVKKPSRENASPETKRARHFNKTAKRIATSLEDGHSPAFSAPRPAAFPSLTDNAPPSLPVAIELTKHGMRELVEAMDAEDYERVRKIKRQFAAKYEADTSVWYDSLRKNWPTAVTFEELWPSIRQEIIERILDDFAQKNYPSPFYPVCRILDITKERLDAIMAENARVWTDDEIPPYFKEYRRRYPKAIVDPDEPPPQCVVEAIAFLKQNSLPGSLLGEWQTMPAVEVFNNPAPFYLPTKKSLLFLLVFPVSPNVSILTQFLLRKPLNCYGVVRRMLKIKPVESSETDKKLPPPQCRVCGQTGHIYWKLDKNGVHECPRRRQQVAQHNAELEILRAQASSEIKAFKERDFAMKNITPNCSLSESTPIDAAPYLEAWQANRANPNLHSHLQQPAALPEDGRAKYINQLQTDNLSHPGTSLHTKRPLSHRSKAATLGLQYGPPCLLATAATCYLTSESSPIPLFRPIHLDSPSLKRYFFGGSDDKQTETTSVGDAERQVNKDDVEKSGQQDPPSQKRVAKGYSEEDEDAGESQSAWQTITAKFPASPSPSKLGDTIIDYIVPNWVKVLPGFIRKLQNELSMAPGSLAEEIWYQANDPEINPEIIWDASVRVSNELCDEEKAFLKKRAQFTKAALARYLDIPEAQIHPDDVPVIAMCGSGGGLRALVAGTSSYLSSKEHGLFDCVTYTAGVSGSCWLQTLYYSDLTQRSHARIIRHLKNRLGVHIAFPPDALELLVSAPTNKYLLSGLVEKAKGIPDADFGLVDIYGALLAARLLVPKGELSVSEYDFKVSNQRRFTDNGSHPLPIYTAVRHEIPLAEQTDTDVIAAEAKARREAWFQWFEFTPYEMWCEEISAGIPTWAMGRRFENGRTVWRDNGLALPEVRVPLLMGIWGSAFCATLSHYYREIRPLMRSLTGLGGSIDAMISERDDDLVKVHPIDPAAMPNYALGMREFLPASCPESIFEQKNFQFMDAGMSNNLPIYPLLRPGRNVDILVAFDASADVKTDNWLKVADGYARQRGIKGWPVGAGWPPDNESMEDLQKDLDRAQARSEQQAQEKLEEAKDKSTEDKKGGKKNKDLGYCNIWVGTTEERTSDSAHPEPKQVDEDWELMHPASGITVIYFPFLANPKVPGVDPKVSDFMSTWNFVYTPEQIDSVVNLARANYSEGAERTKRTVRAVYERKKAQREQREKDERERRWRWKLSQGRIAGRRVGGESEHGDQFS
ncbi:unnamed protein product [Alternaria alternata]